MGGVVCDDEQQGEHCFESGGARPDGRAEAFLLLYDPANNTIGLKPTGVNLKNAYPAMKSGRHGGRRVNAYRLLTECGLQIKETLDFPDAEIDEDGILILNLRTAKISNRALNHPTRRQPAADDPSPIS